LLVESEVMVKPAGMGTSAMGALAAGIRGAFLSLEVRALHPESAAPAKARHTTHDANRIYYGTDTRAPAIALGALVGAWAQWREGMALVSAMHITSGVYVNDWENGLIQDFQVWLEKLAPSGLDYKHHQTGEDNADAHLKRTLMGHQVMLPITAGKLDLGPWEQVFYAEFDGQRPKRVILKAMGD